MNTFQKENPQKISKEEHFDPNCLKLLIKLIDYLKLQGEKEIWQLFLMQERLIFTASFLMEKGTPQQEIGFDFTSEVIQFVQKINLKIMENIGSSKYEDQVYLLSRPIDMLMYKPVIRYIEPFSQALELRILCFDNLSSIYKQNNMPQDALKAVDKAIELENILVSENNIDAIRNIPSTYINKAVILSEQGKHLESIEAIKKALDAMDQFQKNNEANQDKEEAEKMKYLSVIAYFNLAVEHEHLFYTSYAKTFYETALNISRELGYNEMNRTLETVLKKMNEQIKGNPHGKCLK